MNNGVLAYSMNLEKKLKRRKNAVIIEEYKGDLTIEKIEEQLKVIWDYMNNDENGIVEDYSD
jgi:hypothetical protein